VLFYNATILKILTSLVFTVFWRPYVAYIVLTSVWSWKEYCDNRTTKTEA